jgi:hypothetical protein
LRCPVEVPSDWSGASSSPLATTHRGGGDHVAPVKNAMARVSVSSRDCVRVRFSLAADRFHRVSAAEKVPGVDSAANQYRESRPTAFALPDRSRRAPSSPRTPVAIPGRGEHADADRDHDAAGDRPPSTAGHETSRRSTPTPRKMPPTTISRRPRPPAMLRSIGTTSVAIELDQSLVADPEVMRDLVEHDVPDLAA